MGTPASQPLERALELLADGDWHDYGKVVREIGRTVPPGVAMRRAEGQRQSIARAQGYSSEQDRKVHRATHRLVEIGAHAIARQILSNTTRFEIYPRGVRSDGTCKRVRLTRPDSPVGPDVTLSGHTR